MKQTLLVLLSAWTLAGGARGEEEEAAPSTCDRVLMESYDLDGEASLSTDKNLICPGVKFNCCGFGAQMQVYKKFIVAGERDRVLSFYKEFATAYEEIFQSFGRVEEAAAAVQERTAETPGSNCNKVAAKIGLVKASRLFPLVRDAVKRAYDFLYKSRQGFYCGLCDARAHPFFNLTANEVVESQGFCGKMVEETLNYFLFKYTHFPKLSRLYSEFLVKCDLRGFYRKSRFLKYEVKFYRKDRVLGELEGCRRGFDKPGAMAGCARFCSRFNPVRYDEYLEGEVDKLFTYEKTLKQLLAAQEAKYKRDMRDAEEFSRESGRALAEAKDVKATGRLDEDTNEINTFNREFKTALIRPITYSFHEDLSIKYRINFDEALFAPGVERVFNLLEFKPVIQPKGINFYNYGEMAMIDKDTAMKIFEKLNPNNAKDEAEFNKMLSA